MLSVVNLTVTPTLLKRLLTKTEWRNHVNTLSHHFTNAYWRNY